MPLTVDDYSLTDLWQKAVIITGVQENSVQIGDFWLRVEADGRARLQQFYFNGVDRKGRPRLYRVDTNADGKMVWHSNETDSIPSSYDPGLLFTEIDRLGLTSIPAGDDGYSIQIKRQWGNRGYVADNTAIYRLMAGRLTPLQKVTFSTNMPWITIEIYPMYIVSRTVDENGHESKQSTASRDEKSTVQIWFLGDDLNKAKVVDYLTDIEKT